MAIAAYVWSQFACNSDWSFKNADSCWSSQPRNCVVLQAPGIQGGQIKENHFGSFGVWNSGGSLEDQVGGDGARTWIWSKVSLDLRFARLWTEEHSDQQEIHRKNDIRRKMIWRDHVSCLLSSHISIVGNLAFLCPGTLHSNLFGVSGPLLLGNLSCEKPPVALGNLVLRHSLDNFICEGPTREDLSFGQKNGFAEFYVNLALGCSGNILNTFQPASLQKQLGLGRPGNFARSWFLGPGSAPGSSHCTRHAAFAVGLKFLEQENTFVKVIDCRPCTHSRHPIVSCNLLKFVPEFLHFFLLLSLLDANAVRPGVSSRGAPSGAQWCPAHCPAQCPSYWSTRESSLLCNLIFSFSFAYFVLPGC